jgi:ArsR family transcriptional regulator
MSEETSIQPNSSIETITRKKLMSSPTYLGIPQGSAQNYRGTRGKKEKVRVRIKMLKPKSSKRLKRLIESGICPAEDASKYAAELKQIAAQVADAQIADKQGRFFKALADETRLRILKLLEVREMCVCEVMVALDLTQPTASHHLGLLENAGFVKGRKEGTWVFYSIANRKLIENMHKLKVL